MDIKIEDLSKVDIEDIGEYFQRERISFSEKVTGEVLKIIEEVALRGDDALIEYTGCFDGVKLSRDELRVSEDEIEEASAGVEGAILRALDESIKRVGEFHSRNIPEDWSFVDKFGNRIGQRCIPLERIGVYVPGGKASYPSTLIMTVVPAIRAGVREIVIVSPPSSFKKPSTFCAALSKLGIESEVYRVGGVQGVAALAMGTGTIRRVDKIVGPGNVYVSFAKKELYGIVDIDMVAGPSEVCIIADGSVNPRLTAIDLLAQAEHDEDALAYCVTSSRENAEQVKRLVVELGLASRRRDIIERSLSSNGRIYIVRDMDCAIKAANVLAPEHLELHIQDSVAVLSQIRNAGAVFVGKYSAEAFGDYIAGPSHVLPTGGTARFFSPLNLLSFVRFSSLVEISKEGMLGLGKHVSVLAASEGLFCHAESIELRKNEE
ncbi:MAG: histidinol dehydrogenase [Spirochaetota bacterium]